jgi:hypothetical protein
MDGAFAKWHPRINQRPGTVRIGYRKDIHEYNPQTVNAFRYSVHRRYLLRRDFDVVHRIFSR